MSNEFDNLLFWTDNNSEPKTINIDNNAQSSFEAGYIAFDISNADYNKYSYASRNYYHWIGVSLIEISEEVTGVTYDN